MARPNRDLSIEDAVVAYLLAKREPSGGERLQQDLARSLGLTEVQVSRALKRARDAGLLRWQFAPEATSKFDPGQIEEEARRRTRQTQAEEALQVAEKAIKMFADERFPGRLQAVHILSLSKSDNDWEQQIQEFGELASGLTAEFVARTRATLGVAFGRTLRCVINGLRLDPAQERIPLDIFPLWGELCAKPPSRSSRFPYPQLSSSRLTEDLSSIVNGKYEQPRSLAGVPALIHKRHGEPPTGDRNGLRVIKDFLSDNEVYREIFGSELPPEANHPPSHALSVKRIQTSKTRGGGYAKPAPPPHVPLVKRMETAFVAVGSAADKSELFWDPDMAANAALDIELIKKASCGDIGGVLMVRCSSLGLKGRSELFEGVSSKAIHEFNTARRHWTGVKLEHLEGCANRAQEIGTPGVVVFAVGGIRAEIVQAVLALGLVNNLVIDAKLGETLLAKVKTS